MLYQLNLRVFLSDLSNLLGRRATLDDIPDFVLDELADDGFDWLWLLGAWQTGPAGREISRTNPDWLSDYHAVLPDFTEDDICGSPFAVQSYTLHGDFGSSKSLHQFRSRLSQRGLRLVLDFVPNHTAIDHPWVEQRPEYYIHGTDADLEREPQNYLKVASRNGGLVLAHGRDPYFPGWPDTLQLNYRHAGLREAMIAQLGTIAAQCDGVRCDMAMLLLPDVFRRTWSDQSVPPDDTAPVDAAFWPEAIGHIRREHPQFVFIAEAYWDLEWTLQQQGFDFTYDKRLYDRLRDRDAEAVRGHLHADLDFQEKSVRFLENHDESRAAATFEPAVHRASAIITYLAPGLRFFHDGQFDGRRIKASIHLRRRQVEPFDAAIHDFYLRLLECLKRPEVRDGDWRLCECYPAWNANPTFKNFIAFCWGWDERRTLVLVNYSPTRGQCYVKLPFVDLRGRQFALRDLMGAASYDRDGNVLAESGLYVDMPAWGHHVFEMTRR